jgi:TPR repeat protein
MPRDGEGVPRDHAQAVAWFGKAADLRHVRAMSELAVMQAGIRLQPRAVEPNLPDFAHKPTEVT